MSQSFDWDPEKAKQNLRKHGVVFEEAQTVFDDPLSLEVGDPAHSVGEERFIVIGHSSRPRLLVVAYTLRDGLIRIISAREPAGYERRAYERGS